MKKQEWIDFISLTPTKKHGGYWEFNIIPQLAIAGDPVEGKALGIGWLFWVIIIYVPKWK